MPTTCEPVVLRPAQPVPRLLTDPHAPQGTRRPQNQRTRHPFVTFVFVVGGTCVFVCVVVVGGVLAGFLFGLRGGTSVWSPRPQTPDEIASEVFAWHQEGKRQDLERLRATLRTTGGEFNAALVPANTPRRAAPKGFGPMTFGMRTRDVRERFGFGALGGSLGIPGVSSTNINTGEVVEKITVRYEKFPLPATDFFRALVDTYGPPTEIGDLRRVLPPVEFSQTVRWEWPDDDVTVIVETGLEDLTGFRGEWSFAPKLTVERGRMSQERAERKAREDAERKRLADRAGAAKALRSQKTP